MSDLNEFVTWVEQDKRHRSCQISIEAASQLDIKQGMKVRVWVYDYSLMHGQSVTSVSEINIQADKDKEDLDKFNALKAKFGGT